MGTGLIFIGFLFLINPELITLDIFPDFIGFFLIARGLSKLALLEERIASARKWALFLSLTSVLKLLACTITFSTRIESTRLTVCFFFLVAELWMYWLFCDNAFKGLHYLAIRKNGDLVLKSYDLVRNFTLVFFMAKAAINFLPQLPVIFYTNIDAEGDQVENYTAMVRSFRSVRSILFVFGALLLVFLGIYTARILKAYLKRCQEDRAFCDNVLASYRENVSENESLQTRLAIKGAFFWFFLAFICLADLYLDFINMIPKPLFALFVFLGLKRLSSVVKIPAFHLVLTLVSFASELFAFAFRLVRLGITTGNFPYLFPYEPLAWVGTVLHLIFIILPLVLTLLAVSKCTAAYTSQTYGKRGIVVFSLGFFVALLSACQYLFVGRSDLVVFLQWGLYAVLLYLHKSSMDDVFAEAEYKLM